MPHSKQHNRLKFQAWNVPKKLLHIYISAGGWQGKAFKSKGNMRLVFSLHYLLSILVPATLPKSFSLLESFISWWWCLAWWSESSITHRQSSYYCGLPYSSSVVILRHVLSSPQSFPFCYYHPSLVTETTHTCFVKHPTLQPSKTSPSVWIPWLGDAIFLRLPFILSLCTVSIECL